MNNKVKNRYIPMTETAFYILISLNNERHGYGISSHIRDITSGKVEIGPGTMYGT